MLLILLLLICAAADILLDAFVIQHVLNWHGQRLLAHETLTFSQALSMAMLVLLAKAIWKGQSNKELEANDGLTIIFRSAGVSVLVLTIAWIVHLLQN